MQIKMILAEREGGGDRGCREAAGPGDRRANAQPTGA